MKTILYKVSSSEIPALLNQLGEAYYWRRSNSKLLRWSQGQWHKTDYDVGDDPLSTLPELPITGTVLLEGIFDQGLTPKITHQIMDATFQGVDQQWVLNMPKGNISPDLAPFVVQKAWRLPTSAEITEYLKTKGIYTDRLLRGCLGLTWAELKLALMGLEDPEIEIAQFKLHKLSRLGINQKARHKATGEVSAEILELIDKVGFALLPDAEAVGLPFPKGMLVIQPIGTDLDVVAETAATRLGVPLISVNRCSFDAAQSSLHQRINVLTDAAEALAPCIFSWDASTESITGKALGYLLTWLQERTVPVFCIMTCNSIESVSPELKRRFDWRVYLNLLQSCS